MQAIALVQFTPHLHLPLSKPPWNECFVFRSVGGMQLDVLCKLGGLHPIGADLEKAPALADEGCTQR